MYNVSVMATRFHVKSIFQYIKKNLYISIFVCILFFAFILILFKLFTTNEETAYVEVKVSQGLWWVNSAKPASWILQSVKKGDVEVSTLGKPISEVVGVRYYPYRDTELYDMFIKLKVAADYNKKTGKFTYKRSNLTVGSPIDLDFSQFQLTGTVISVSDKPIEDHLVKKEITIFKPFVTNEEYKAISEGDSFYDGTEKVFEIDSIDVRDTYSNYNAFGNNYPIETNIPKNVTIKASIWVTETNHNLVYGREKVLRVGQRIDASTNHYLLDNYRVVAISN